MPRSALALAALATTAVPGLDAVATTEPQRITADMQLTGVQDSAGRRWVVRCPLHPAAAAQFEGERGLLELLTRAVHAGELPFEVPRSAGVAPLPEGGHIMVSPLMRGRPMDLDELHPGPGLSASLGAALAALHELDPDVVAEAGLPVYTADSYRRRCLAEVDEAARTGRVPSVLLHRWERALEDVTLWRFRATPVHADLAAEQVLVADGTVTAMMSFGEAHVGDPAEDLAWLMASAPEDALDSIIEAYVVGRDEHADPALLDRAMLMSELALARWLLHGFRTRDEGVVHDAVQMLEELAQDVMNAPPIGYHEPAVVSPSDGWPESEDEWGDHTDVGGEPESSGVLRGELSDEAQDFDAAKTIIIPGRSRSYAAGSSPVPQVGRAHHTQGDGAPESARRGSHSVTVTDTFDLEGLGESSARR